jgi:antimicrobial peptide system SdpA family protein
VLLTVAGLSSVAVTLPSNIVWERTQLPKVRAVMNMIAGQSFGFFTRSPETEQFDVYRLRPDGSVGGSLLVTPQAKPANLFGISRTQRAQGPEIANLIRAVPTDGWNDCVVLDRRTCIQGLSNQPKVRLRDNSLVPTVCGDIVLTIESTAKWAYRHLTETRYTIEHVAKANVECDHTP